MNINSLLNSESEDRLITSSQFSISSLLTENNDEDEHNNNSYNQNYNDYNDYNDYYGQIRLILQLLKCPKCNRLFKDPVTFSCGNTFCRRCLLISSVNQRFHCPVRSCNRLHRIDARTDFSIGKLVDTIQREQLHVASSSSLVKFDFDQFKDLLSQELDCKVCYQLILDPITTPCGHTYCKSCLTRSLDHSDKCPLCRFQLMDYISFLNHPINKTIHTLIISLFPTLLAERKLQLVENEVNEEQFIPIFVTSLVFPNMPCHLNVFEPRYKLMIRRCLESRTNQFGMALKNGDGFMECGTMLEIRSTEFLDDGRILIETVGTYRFRVLEKRMRDGYDIGRIERIDDINPEEEISREREAIRNAEINNADYTKPPINEPTTSELITIASEFIENLRNGYAPWLLQRINSTFGDMPSEASDFSFWVASVLPIDEIEKYKLLEERSVRGRLKLVVEWINQLEDQWWFRRGCCIC